MFPRSVGDILGASARRWGAKTALVFEDETYSFNDLDRKSSLIAHHLEALGCRRGDCISLYAANCPEWIVAYYAIMKIGAIANPLNLMLTPDEAAYAMNDCGARAVFGSADKIAGLADVRNKTKLEHCIAFGGATPDGAIDFKTLLIDPEEESLLTGRYPVEGIDLDDVCTVGYTSGTTGHPKGAVLAHRSIVMNVAMTATMHTRTDRDVIASALPFSHVYGNIVMQTAIAYGGTLVLYKTFDAGRVLQGIARHQCTLFEGVPTMYMYLLDYPALREHDVSSLTRCTVGGQTMPEAQMRAAEDALGCPLIELWGMTELGGLGTTHTLYGPRKLGSIGIALPHLEARIFSLEGVLRALPPGEVGELQIRGPVTMREYLGRPEATAETLMDGGWLRTGDLARIDDEGFIFVVDRLKDMIITGGFNIYPAELERVIAEHADVAMVAVTAIPDAIKGELAKAYIVPKQGRTPDVADIEHHCRERLAAYKVPRAWQVVADLPKTSSGKVLRRLLKTLG
ncbi:acyl-CoA synthase [Variovorax sp. WS11]|nr:long-chain fatty acid--CoA ligase [Variovorax sp. WS11]PSL82501.1 acyl-CoA synthase [Variovorax sp. WS11]